MSSNRKNRALRNLGGEFSEELTNPTASGREVMRTNVVLVERFLIAILRQEVERLVASHEECDRFFSHFFDPSVDEEEREEFVKNFRRLPPTIVLGYPRTSATFPCISIVLSSEQETDNAVGDFIMQTSGDSKDKEPQEFVGAHFSQSHMVYVYAEHPDVVIYLYQFVKLCLFGAKQALLEAGCTEVTFAGGELAPDEGYMPENMFVRYVQVQAKALVAIPRLLLVDPRRMKLGGVFMCDVVVDGVQGGVHPYAATNPGTGAGGDDDEG